MNDHECDAPGAYVVCYHADCFNNLRIRKVVILSLLIAGPFSAAMGILYLVLPKVFSVKPTPAITVTTDRAKEEEAGVNKEGGEGGVVEEGKVIGGGETGQVMGEGGGGGGNAGEELNEHAAVPDISPPSSGRVKCSETQLAAVVEKVYTDSDQYRFLCSALNLGDNLAVVLAECFESKEPSPNVHFLKSSSPFWSQGGTTHAFKESKTISEGGKAIIALVMSPPLPTPCAGNTLGLESVYDASVPHYIMGWKSFENNVESLRVVAFNEKCVENMNSAAVFRRYGFFSGFQKVACNANTSKHELVIIFADFIEKLAEIFKNVNVFKGHKYKDKESVTGSGDRNQEFTSEIGFRAMDNRIPNQKVKGKNQYEYFTLDSSFENETKIRKGKHKNGQKKIKIQKLLPTTEYSFDTEDYYQVFTTDLHQRKKYKYHKHMHILERYTKRKMGRKKHRKQFLKPTSTLSIDFTPEEEYDETTTHRRRHRPKYTRFHRQKPTKRPFYVRITKIFKTSTISTNIFNEEDNFGTQFNELYDLTTPSIDVTNEVQFLTHKPRKHHKKVTLTKIKCKIIKHKYIGNDKYLHRISIPSCKSCNCSDNSSQDYTATVEPKYAPNPVFNALMSLFNVTVKNKLTTRKISPTTTSTKSSKNKIKVTATSNLPNNTFFSIQFTPYQAFKISTLKKSSQHKNYDSPSNQLKLNELDKAIHALMGTTSDPDNPIDQDEFMLEDYLLNQPLDILASGKTKKISTIHSRTNSITVFYKNMTLKISPVHSTRSNNNKVSNQHTKNRITKNSTDSDFNKQFGDDKLRTIRNREKKKT